MATYDLIKEFTDAGPETDDLSSSSYWVMAVVRLAKPLSYSRQDKGSVTLDVTEGARTRGRTLVITSDCVQLQVQNQKENHVKQLQATLIQTRFNYLVEVLPGDWVLTWIVHGRDKFDDLVDRIKRGKPCNGFEDGFKFLGRVESVRKSVHRDRSLGTKVVRYQVQAFGFRELDTQVFYDKFMAENSVSAQNLGRWLARIGLDITELFAANINGPKDNSHLLITKLVEVILGRGFNANTLPQVQVLRQQFGGGVFSGVGNEVLEAPFAYLVPAEVGALLGRTNSSKPGGILSYCDVLERVVGVQKYSGGTQNEYPLFLPDISFQDPLTVGNQKFTGIGLMGAFLPNFPDLTNTPLWSILQQYLNPVVNEMYTCLRVTHGGSVVPTLVVRQIPFTTDILANKIDASSAVDAITGAGALGQVERPTYTSYMTLPRWVMQSVLVHDVNVGRSNATRCNFVHVFGQSAVEAKNVPITSQIVQNPPIADDFDIQRSGLHPYMTTVACRYINTVGTTPSAWMELIADHRIGSQYTLNGTINSIGITAPIAEGDNLEFDGVVYHIESVSHSCSCDPNGGNRQFETALGLSHGLRAVDSASDTDPKFPLYPGFKDDDNTGGDPNGGPGGEQTDDDDANSEPTPQPVEAPPFDPNGDANA